MPFYDIPDECFEELNKTVNDIKAKFIQNKRWLVEEFENIVRSSSKEGDIINTIKSKSNQTSTRCIPAAIGIIMTLSRQEKIP